MRALVLGGTSGMGWAVAKGLAAQGASVAVSGRTPGRDKAAELPGGQFVPCDLADPEQVTGLVQFIAKEQPSILVMNSGGPPPSSAQDVTQEALAAALQQLFLAQVQLAQAALPGMKERGWGRLVAIGSSGIRAPIPNLVLSNVARAALAAYLKTLAAEVAQDGVTVNMVLPGRIDTDRVRKLDAARAEANGTSEDEERRISMTSIPAGRYGQAEEFAAGVTFLCGRSASFITGTQLVVDGGMLRDL